MLFLWRSLGHNSSAACQLNLSARNHIATPNGTHLYYISYIFAIFNDFNNNIICMNWLCRQYYAEIDFFKYFLQEIWLKKSTKHISLEKYANCSLEIFLIRGSRFEKTSIFFYFFTSMTFSFFNKNLLMAWKTTNFNWIIFKCIKKYNQ